jgi:hypothetical protein
MLAGVPVAGGEGRDYSGRGSGLLGASGLLGQMWMPFFGIQPHRPKTRTAPGRHLPSLEPSLDFWKQHCQYGCLFSGSNPTDRKHELPLGCIYPHWNPAWTFGSSTANMDAFFRDPAPQTENTNPPLQASTLIGTQLGPLEVALPIWMRPLGVHA